MITKFPAHNLIVLGGETKTEIKGEKGANKC
jgi:hypothetical protein